MASTKIKSVPIRGNIQRRIHQLKSSGKFDAIVIAEAALQRLPSLRQHVSWSRLDPSFFIPSPAQGCIAVEASSASAKRIINAVSSDDESVRATTVERGVLAGVGGDCRTPIGVHSQRCGSHIVTRAVILDGRGEEVRAQVHSDADEPAWLTVDRVLEALHAQSLYLVLDSILGSPQS
jgi:hydroxymethylbilane synthase